MLRGDRRCAAFVVLRDRSVGRFVASSLRWRTFDGKTPVYLATWREHPSAPEQSKAFARKADAERYLVDVQHRLLTGTYAPPKLGRTPFAEVAERYLTRSTWRPRTRQSAEERLRYAVARFGDRPIASIRKGEIQSFVAELDLAPSTIRVVMQHTTAVFATALDDGLIGGRNPCAGVRLPRVDNPAVLPLTVDQVAALLDEADDWFAVAIAIGAGLGLRQSEATGHTVDRVLPSSGCHRRPAVAAGEWFACRCVRSSEDSCEHPSDTRRQLDPRPVGGAPEAVRRGRVRRRRRHPLRGPPGGRGEVRSLRADGAEARRASTHRQLP